MSNIFAGVAVFPAGVDEYNVFVSLISSTNGCIIDNKSTSSPVSRTSLTETVRSMILPIFPERRTITSYFTSVPPAFPPDRYYDIFKALKLAHLTESWEFPPPPLNHGEAFAATLQAKGKTTTVLALDFSCPGHLYSASLLSTEAHGKRVSTIIHELSVSLVDDNSLRGALETFNHEALNGTYNIPEQIMLIKRSDTSTEAGSVDIDGVISTLYPDVPLSVVTGNVIAQAAVSFVYANFLVRKPQIRSQRTMLLPASVATTSGATVPLSVSTIRIPISFFVILTNSIDNQKSVTVRVLLGNHKQAKDNLERAVVVLDGLKPLPKGEARIKVLIKVLALDPWREAIRISIEQKDGPKKKFLFPRFSAYLPEGYEKKYEIPVKLEKDPVFWSDRVLGSLPE